MADEPRFNLKDVTMNLHTAGCAPLIGVVTGNARHGRLGNLPAHWLYRVARVRNDVQVELIDLGNVQFPFFGAAAGLGAPFSARDRTRYWTPTFERLDGVIVVVPDGESPTTRDSMSIDSLVESLSRKPVAFVTLGAKPVATMRQHLNDLASRLGMAPMETSVDLSDHEVLSIRDMLCDFEDFPHLGRVAEGMLDELCGRAHALVGACTKSTLTMGRAGHRTSSPVSVVGNALHALREWMADIAAAASHWNARAIGRAPPWLR